MRDSTRIRNLRAVCSYAQREKARRGDDDDDDDLRGAAVYDRAAVRFTRGCDKINKRDEGARDF